MKKIIRIVQDEPTLMHLTWLINNICPNSCSYCPSTLHNGKNHHYDWGNARIFFKLLFERYPKIHCSISGGEPSVSPFLPEIVNIFQDAGHTVGLTSNAAKSVKFWEEISPKLNYVCFSYHPEFPNPTFIEKVTESSKHTFTTVRIMMHPRYWDQAVDMFYQLSDLSYLYVEPVRLVDWGTSDKTIFNYTDDQLQFFINNSRNPNKYLPHLAHITPVNMMSTFYFDDNTVQLRGSAVDYVNHGMTNFKEYQCEIGLKSLFIDYQGRIRRGNCDVGGIIGNINDPLNIQWPTQPVTCDENLCWCSSDININKFIP